MYVCIYIYVYKYHHINPEQREGPPKSHPVARSFFCTKDTENRFGKMDAAKSLVQHSQVGGRSRSKSWANMPMICFDGLMNRCHFRKNTNSESIET